MYVWHKVGHLYRIEMAEYKFFGKPVEYREHKMNIRAIPSKSPLVRALQ